MLRAQALKVIKMNGEEDLYLLFSIYVAYVVFSGILGLVQSNALKAGPEALSAIEWKMWCDNTPLAATLSFLSLAARLNGIGYLVYLVFMFDWFVPLLFFVGSLAIAFTVISVLRMTVGLLVPSFLSFVVIPVAGVSLWLMT
ncbi:MAG: hypothetical protein H2060_03650 [Azoarcus sp.]|nr:hypothetical protein [Azoarcus sp.]